MHQQLRSFYRHLLQGLTLGLSAVGLFSSAARSHHDDVPDPPPQSSSNHLAALPNLVPTAITVSGISSGGFFAHQFHVAYSKLVNGAGIIAGGPFACVENVPNPYYVFWTVPLDRVSAATVACTHYFGSSYFGLRPSTPRAESSLEAIRQARRRRAIDDPANLADDRVWLFHGEHDEIVPEPVARSLEEVYRALGVLDLQADWNDHGRAASHGMPVERFTGQSKFPTRECEEHEPPFIIQCGFDATRSLLQHLYPENATAPSWPSTNRSSSPRRRKLSACIAWATSMCRTLVPLSRAACTSLFTAASRIWRACTTTSSVMQATISGQPATQSLSSIRRQPARRQIRTAVGISGATVGRAISGRTGRRCGLLKAWWIGFSAQAREGAQGAAPLVVSGKGGAARAALKVVGLPQREEELIKDERHHHYTSRGQSDIVMPRILHSYSIRSSDPSI